MPRSLTPDDAPTRLGWLKENGRASTSYSALTLHRRCPQAWRYRHVLKIERPRTEISPAPAFGIFWGALRSADALERGRRLGSLIGKPGSFSLLDDLPRLQTATVTTDDVAELMSSWWRRLDGETRDLYVEYLGAELPTQVHETFARWKDVYGEQTKRERPLGVEVFWKREIPRLEQLGVPGAERDYAVDLLGFIDELYFDEELGMVVVRDNKAHKQLATSHEQDAFDSQLQLYAWGAMPLLKEHGLDAPKAVSYDRVRMIAQPEPKLTATGRLAKTPSLYDERTYRDWASLDTRPDAAEITKIVAAEGLKGEAAFARTTELCEAVSALPAGQFWGKLGEYVKTGARKGEAKFGVYEIEQGEIDRISTPDHLSAFFQRTRTPISKHLVRAHLVSAIDTVDDQVRTERRAAVLGEAARNLGKSACQFCDYAELCRAQMVGGPEGEYELAQFGLIAKDGRTTA